MLNIVIPMAGRGSRFRNAGYSEPKPLIKVNGTEMIRIVIGNLKPKCEHRFIFLCLQEHIEQYHVEQKLKEWSPECIVIPVKEVTEGAACTVLLAESLIDSNAPLMIANSDQWVDVDINNYLKKLGDSDGLIMTMKASDPKWSYVRFDSSGRICEVVEKNVVSDEATVGIYNFRHGNDFVKYAHRMIRNNLRVNNEFYVAPVYNQMIKEGGAITVCNIGTDVSGMYGLGIPDDLNYFLSLDICKKALEEAV